MAGDLAEFQFPTTGQAIRTLNRDGEPWFVAADVCAALALGNPSQTVTYLDEDERDTTLISNEGAQPRHLNIVNEPGLYSLIMRSRKPEAKAFKRWVTHDVLPAIRKTGRYEAAPLGDELAEIERQAQLAMKAVERARAERAMREVAVKALGIAAPKADAWEAMASAEGDFLVREAAIILSRDPNIRTGEQRLYRHLREWNILDARNRPYSEHSKHVVARLVNFTDGWGNQRVKYQPRVTVDGLRYLHKKMGGRMPFGELLQELSQPIEVAAIPGPRAAAGALFELEAM